MYSMKIINIDALLLVECAFIIQGRRI